MSRLGNWYPNMYVSKEEHETYERQREQEQIDDERREEHLQTERERRERDGMGFPLYK